MGFNHSNRGCTGEEEVTGLAEKSGKSPLGYRSFVERKKNTPHLQREKLHISVLLAEWWHRAEKTVNGGSMPLTLE